jgi:hypothetical protein
VGYSSVIPKVQDMSRKIKNSRSRPYFQKKNREREREQRREAGLITLKEDQTEWERSEKARDCK